MIFVHVSVFLNSADVCILNMPRCFLLGRRSWAGHGWLLLHYLSRCGRVGSEGRAQRFARRMIRLVEATGTVWNHQLPKLVFPGSASRQDATEQSWNNLLIFKQAKCQGNVLPLLTYKHTCTTYRGEPLTHKLSTISLRYKYLDKNCRVVCCVVLCVCVCGVVTVFGGCGGVCGCLVCLLWCPHFSLIVQSDF